MKNSQIVKKSRADKRSRNKVFRAVAVIILLLLLFVSMLLGLL